MAVGSVPQRESGRDIRDLGQAQDLAQLGPLLEELLQATGVLAEELAQGEQGEGLIPVGNLGGTT
jgi:hypothetical protein